MRFRQAISQIFSIPDQKSPEIFRSYVSIINLSLEVKDRLNAIPDINIGLYEKSLNEIEKHLAAFNIEKDLDAFKGGLKNENFLGLEFISDKFDEVEKEEEINEEDLKKLEIQIDDLIETVKNANTSPDFIQFLVSHLFAIKISVQNYRFFGAVGIQTAMARVIGEVFLDPRGATTDEKKQSLVRKVFDTIKDANTLISFVRNGVHAIKALPLDAISKLMGE